MLTKRNGSTSGDHPREVGYIRKKAVLPLTGSGGFSGSLGALAFLGAESEQADSNAKPESTAIVSRLVMWTIYDPILT
ncbi:MAG: hypothetical protein ACRD8O_08835, partial [Bryobacteraceae bacterium]